MKIKEFIVIFTLLFIIPKTNVFAQADDIFNSIANFPFAGTSVRNTGIGGVSIAVDDYESDIWFNPAKGRHINHFYIQFGGGLLSYKFKGTWSEQIDEYDRLEYDADDISRKISNTSLTSAFNWKNFFGGFIVDYGIETYKANRETKTYFDSDINTESRFRRNEEIDNSGFPYHIALGMKIGKISLGFGYTYLKQTGSTDYNQRGSTTFLNNDSSEVYIYQFETTTTRKIIQMQFGFELDLGKLSISGTYQHQPDIKNLNRFKRYFDSFRGELKSHAFETIRNEGGAKVGSIEISTVHSQMFNFGLLYNRYSAKLSSSVDVGTDTEFATRYGNSIKTTQLNISIHELGGGLTISPNEKNAFYLNYIHGLWNVERIDFSTGLSIYHFLSSPFYSPSFLDFNTKKKLPLFSYRTVQLRVGFSYKFTDDFEFRSGFIYHDFKRTDTESLFFETPSLRIGKIPLPFKQRTIKIYTTGFSFRLSQFRFDYFFRLIHDRIIEGNFFDNQIAIIYSF